MQASKEFMKDSGFVPRISFKEQSKHRVVLISDKVDSITDDKGEERKGVRYLVTEDGGQKEFFTSSIYLIQQLSGFEAGAELDIEMKSKKGKSGFITVFEVTEVGSGKQDAPKEISIDEL